MDKRSKISEPSENMKEILSIVRLLPANITLPDFYPFYIELLTEDPEERFSFIRETYGVEEYEHLNPYSYPSDKKGNDAYTLEMTRAKTIYSLKALKKSVLDLPIEFIEYVDLPKPTIEDQFEKYKVMQNDLNISFEEFIDMVANSLGFMEAIHSLSVTEAIVRYEDAQSYYIRLYKLMNYIKQWENDSNNLQFYKEKHDLFALKDVIVIDGKIFFLPDKFTVAFISGVDINRLKLCGNCGRVFWVKRLDMKGCSVACAKVLRTRKWREKTTEEQRTLYKVNRIEKELKRREPKDGTL